MGLGDDGSRDIPYWRSCLVSGSLVEETANELVGCDRPKLGGKGTSLLVSR